MIDTYFTPTKCALVTFEELELGDFFADNGILYIKAYGSFAFSLSGCSCDQVLFDPATLVTKIKSVFISRI